MKVAVAQIAPVMLDRAATLAKVVDAISNAAGQGADLVAFGESLVPAYPLWIARTDGARFDADDQKALHARYVDQAVCLEDGHLADVQAAAKQHGLTVILGIAERPRDRGGHSLFCTRVIIDSTGRLHSRHRKLQPTYEERLAWAAGDGAGLVTCPVAEFSVGALNCWENWMPLARAAMYAAGENCHVMLWPGDHLLTEDITRFVAREGRLFVVSASVLIRAQDIPADVPSRERICGNDTMLYDGGSCIAAPDGSWLIPPICGEETVAVADLDLQQVYAARQNFDPVGHYSRPDVLQLTVDRRPQKAAQFVDPAG